jgi:integrase
MSFSGLYRRPSGIYVLRLVVPARWRVFLGRGEIHSSTGCHDLPEAKLIASRFQVYWREQFANPQMDVNQLVAGSPLLSGKDAVIGIVEAASAAGLTINELLGELQRTPGARLVVHATGWQGWRVPDLSKIDKDGAGYVLNDVEEHGDVVVWSRALYCQDNRATVGRLKAAGYSDEEMFLIPKTQVRAALFLLDVQRITPADCSVQKSLVEAIRVRLAGSVSPTALEASRGPANAVAAAPAMALDPITARHGKMRFSELFALMKATKKSWSQGTLNRMTTEAGLFQELMHDPELGSIEIETVTEYAARLSMLPSDIYQAKRKFKTDSLTEIAEIAECKKLKCKESKTVIGHVHRLSEILGWAADGDVRKMAFNPASGFGRNDKKNKKKKKQDNRDAFSDDDLDLIFSADWFKTGTGKFNKSGSTNWRPHYYWLPLMGLFVGGRINELSQLYLKDVVQSKSGVWYFDFNLDDRDKIKDEDGEDIGPDGSLKTINSERIVPVHDCLIRFGLLDYIEALEKVGHNRLFPELKHDAIKGYGKPAGSWFNERYLGRKLGMKRDGRKTFHSFRHTCLTTLGHLENPEIGERVIAELAGHVRGETESGNVYIKDRAAEKLKPTIDRLDFAAVADVAPFKSQDGLKAIKWALRLKQGNARVRKP